MRSVFALKDLHWLSMIPTLEWTEDGIRLLDQTRLPLEETYVLATSYQKVADAITTMIDSIKSKATLRFISAWLPLERSRVPFATFDRTFRREGKFSWITMGFSSLR